MPTQIKSPEQRMLEKATEEYLSKLNSIFKIDVHVEISIARVPLSKIAHIAEFIDGCEVNSIISSAFGVKLNYINPEIHTVNYRISSISE